MEKEKLQQILENIEENEMHSCIIESEVLIYVLAVLSMRYNVDFVNDDDDQILENKYYMLDTQRINKNKFRVSIMKTEDTRLC